MPHWEGIEDTSAEPAAVWLSRRRATVSNTSDREGNTNNSNNEPWQPLRKVDCQVLNAAPPQSTAIHIECGRSTADPTNGLIRHNFFRAEERELVPSIWFVREEKSSNQVVLHPVENNEDQVKMETLYQKAVQATSSLGRGIASVLEEQVVLDDGATKIQVNKAGDALSMRQIPPGWFKNSVVLQRGYGAYEVEGEEVETALGPVRSCIFVVHGIGEALFSREEIKITGIMKQTQDARLVLQRKQYDEWQRQCEKAIKNKEDRPAPPNRIEIIPIEWFSRMHDSSTALMRSLNATTLDTIPALRAIANDVVFDVLMYLTPAFCQAVLECVTEQINNLYTRFQEVHPDFALNGGKFSFVGHSLGSVICWDLLAILKGRKDQTPSSVNSDVPSSQHPSHPMGYEAYAMQEGADKALNGTWGPSLTKPMSQAIPFEPAHTFFLGSPLGIFLTLRGAHPCFDELRRNSASIVSPFTIPTNSLYNIFHPSDPVAYRIEPLLLPQNFGVDEIPPPIFLTPPGKDVRLHLKAKQLGDVVRKSIFDQKKGASTGWSLLGSAVTALSTEITTVEDNADESNRAVTATRPIAKFPLGGTNDRVDFCLQTEIIKNDYVNAVTAHSTYFTNNDILDFLIGIVVPDETKK